MLRCSNERYRMLKQRQLPRLVQSHGKTAENSKKKKINVELINGRQRDGEGARERDEKILRNECSES